MLDFPLTIFWMCYFVQAASGTGKTTSSKSKAFKSPKSAKENAGFGIYEDGAEETPCQVHANLMLILFLFIWEYKNPCFLHNLQVQQEEQTPATGRASRTSARRKENLAASASKSKETLPGSTSKTKEAAGSTKKPPRMAALPEADSVGRPPSRRKAALKRLWLAI